jgi:N-ethylmaleimide reductase
VNPLFKPLQCGAWTLPNRIVMPPMTRCRTSQPGDLPNALMAEYYAQRASAGLIVAEATQISRQGQGYSFTPGIHTPAQVEGWRTVTQAVHRARGRIVLQLWHVGRMSHGSFHADGQPVAPSAIAPGAQVWVAEPQTGQGRMLDCPVPRALDADEIRAIVEDYRRAALSAMAAGFDGVEIHAANGYLIDQFLRSSANHRSDRYGGSVGNRLRFLLEVVDAVTDAVGGDRVGVRVSPGITARGMACPDILPVTLQAARALSVLGVAYLHLAEVDGDAPGYLSNAFREQLRSNFSGTLVVTGQYSAERAVVALELGHADLVGFGRLFVANPDLPRRLREGLPMALSDPSTFFGGDARGYTDYPALPQLPRSKKIGVR